MAVIGRFGPDPATLDDGGDVDEFEFCGELFRVPAVTSLPMTRFAWDLRRLDAAETRATSARERARARLDVALDRGDTVAAAAAQDEVTRLAEEIADYGIQQMAALHQMLRDSITEDQWDRFQELAIRYRVDQETLFSIVAALMQAAAARPTRPSGGSANGPLTSGTGSPDGSTSMEPAGPTPAAAATEYGQWTAPPSQMSDRDRAAAEIRAAMVPVDPAATRYSG